MADLIETCCFNEPRDWCRGAGCVCGCHAPRMGSLADRDGLPAPERRVLDAAELLTPTGSFVYGRPRGDNTPIPTCVGCGGSDWRPDRIVHLPTCRVGELIAAVRALGRRP